MQTRASHHHTNSLLIGKCAISNLILETELKPRKSKATDTEALHKAALHMKNDTRHTWSK